MPNPVVHFEIMSKEPKKLAQFYNDAFEWKIDTFDPSAGGAGVPEYFMIKPTGEDTPTRNINGGLGAPPEGYSGHVTFYIAVDDVGASLAKIEQLGGKRMMGPDKVPNGPVIGLFTDPNGNTIGLVEADTP